MQKITIELNDESNLAFISPYLTNDTLFIEKDFLPKEFNDFFTKWQWKNVVNDLGPEYALVFIWAINQSNTYNRYVGDHGEGKADTKHN